MSSKRKSNQQADDSDHAWLIVVREEPCLWRVSLQADRLNLENLVAPFALSPVFAPQSFRSNAHIAPNARICFFFHPRAYNALSKLTEDQRKGLWFSEGLASIVGIGQSKKQTTELLNLWKNELNAYEIWDLKNYAVSHPTVWNRDIADPDNSNSSIKLAVPSGLHRDISNLATQVSIGLSQIYANAAQYAPEIRSDLALLATDIQAVLNEIAFLENPKRENLPASISAEQAEQLRTSPADRIAQLNHRTDLLVQFNSSLSYVGSQGFHGAAPILEQRCLVADHSLLGVGGAWRALSRFSYYVTKAMSSLPITRVVEREYRGRVPVSLDDETRWEDIGTLDPDSYLEHCESVQCLPKLAFFSSRLGFGETNYNITAASQALHAADSTRWSLITLTHEMMHAHVTGLLASIFCNERASRKIIDNFDELQREWIKWQKDKEVGNIGDCFLRNLRCWILENRLQAHHLSHSIAKERAAPANGEELLAFWREGFRFLNEVLVHTLDFHYFYNEDVDTYLDAIWESWITVPGVIDNPKEYILRSMVTIGSAVDGNLKTCRANAKRDLERCIERLLQKRSNEDFLKIAQGILSDAETEQWLDTNFPLHLRLAKVARRFLRSKYLQTVLSSNDDENLQATSIDSDLEYESLERDIYDLETGAFTGARVNNPVAFLRDRLWRNSAEEATHFSEEFRSAWLFLVLSDAKCRIESPDK